MNANSQKAEQRPSTQRGGNTTKSKTFDAEERRKQRNVESENKNSRKKRNFNEGPEKTKLRVAKAKFVSLTHSRGSVLRGASDCSGRLRGGGPRFSGRAE